MKRKAKLVEKEPYWCILSAVMPKEHAKSFLADAKKDECLKRVNPTIVMLKAKAKKRKNTKNDYYQVVRTVSLEEFDTQKGPDKDLHKAWRLLVKSHTVTVREMLRRNGK